MPEFDWVVVLCGINDCGRLLRNDYEERKKVVTKKTFARIYTDGMYYRRFALFRFFSDLAKTIFARTSNYTVVQDLSGEWYREKRLSRQAALKKNTFRRPPPELEMALATVSRGRRAHHRNVQGAKAQPRDGHTTDTLAEKPACESGGTLDATCN